MSGCQIHGATQGDLPCAWCHKGRSRQVIATVPPLAEAWDERDALDVTAPVRITLRVYSLEQLRHPDGREWRVWVLVENAP